MIGFDGAAVRNELLLQWQRQRVFEGRLPRFDPYLGALVSGGAVQFTAADGVRWVLDERNSVREWAPGDAGLPGAEL